MYKRIVVLIFILIPFKYYSQGSRGINIVIHGITDPLTQISTTNYYNNSKKIPTSSKSAEDGKFIFKMPFIVLTGNFSMATQHLIISFSNPSKREGRIYVEIPDQETVQFLYNNYEIDTEISIPLKEKTTERIIKNGSIQEADIFGYITWNKINKTFVYTEKKSDSLKKESPPKIGEKTTLKNIFFETGKSKLLPASYEELKKLAAYLVKNKNTSIEISGHTDNTGNEDLNKQLSEARAKAVADYLILKGIDKTRVTYKGCGSKMPIAKNDTEEGRQQNRRVEFIINTK